MAMTTEEAWNHIMAQAPAKDAKDAEALAVLGLAVFSNLASISQSLSDISFEIREIRTIYGMKP